MKFTASQNYQLISNALGKSVNWTSYARVITNFSGSMNDSTWIDVSNYIPEIPDVTSAIEYTVGQFKTDSINIKAKNITYWTNTFFTDSITQNDAQYIEFKLQATLGLGSLTTTDLVIPFTGFVDKEQINYTEVTDEVDFTVYSADEQASRISAQILNTQYVTQSSVFTGVILPQIPGIYVAAASHSSVGSHTVQYSSQNADGLIKRSFIYDDGIPVVVSSVWNAATPSAQYIGIVDSNNINQAVLYANFLNTIDYLPPNASGSVSSSSTIVNTSYGTALPQNLYYGLSTKQMLRNIYNLMGITSSNFDTMTYLSWDGNSRISYYDTPPQDYSVQGTRWAITNDGTNLYMGVGSKVYKRDMALDSYTLLFDVGGSSNVSKLIYNARNNHLWVLSGNDGTTNINYVCKYDLTGATIVTSSAITPVGHYTTPNAITLIDYNWTGSNWKYSLLYTDVGDSKFKEWDGNTFAVTTVYTSTSSCYPAPFLTYISGGNSVNFTEDKPYGFGPYNDTWYIRRLTVSSSGTWRNDGWYTNPSPIINNKAIDYNPFENKIYHYFYGDGNLEWAAQSIYAWTPGTVPDSLTPILEFSNVDQIYAANNVVYTTYQPSDSAPWQLAVISAGVPTIPSASNSVHSVNTAMTFRAGYADLYGLDDVGRLYKYGPYINMFVNDYDYSQLSLRDFLNKILNSYNLVGTISPNKIAYVYRRGDSSGNPQNTGNTLYVNVDVTYDLLQVEDYGQKATFVTFSDGDLTVSYNGSGFNQGIFNDLRQLDFTNEFIGDDLIYDACYNFYTFFNTKRRLYRIQLGAVPLFQYEPLDACNITFTTTKIQRTATGVIYSITYSMDGTTSVDVLV